MPNHDLSPKLLPLPKLSPSYVRADYEGEAGRFILTLAGTLQQYNGTYRELGIDLPSADLTVKTETGS